MVKSFKSDPAAHPFSAGARNAQSAMTKVAGSWSGPVSYTLKSVYLLGLIPPLKPGPEYRFPAAPITCPTSFVVSTVIARMMSVVGSRLPKTVPIFSYHRKCVPIGDPGQRKMLITRIT